MRVDELARRCSRSRSRICDRSRRRRRSRESPICGGWHYRDPSWASPCLSKPTRVSTGRSTAGERGIDRPLAGARDQQIERSEKHQEIIARLVRHAPEPVAGDLRRMKYQRSWAAQIGNLVETIATNMMMISGIAASRVRKPRMMSTPQVTRRRRRTDPSARDREYQYWQSGPHQNFGEHKLRNPFGEKHDKANHQANKMVQPSARVWSRSTHRLIAAPPSTSSGRR